jgi:aspartate racemase
MKKYKFFNRSLIIIFLLIIKPLCFSNCTSKPSKKALKEDPKAMKTLGLIGGTSWHSTIDYYRTINESVNLHFGNNTNPPLLVYTIDQAKVHRFQKENKWDSIADMLSYAGLKLKAAGAEAVLFCANTPHKVYDQVQENLKDISIIHVADATVKAVKNKDLSKVGFIGTKYSMEEDFITKRIESNGIEVLVPKDKAIINELQRIIAEELTYGVVKADSKEYVINVLQTMIDNGANGLILGCTEFPLMISQDDFSIPVFNTSLIHSKAAVNFILKQEN